MYRYAVLSWPAGGLIGFVRADDAAGALAAAREIWQGGAIAVRRERRSPQALPSKESDR